MMKIYFFLLVLALTMGCSTDQNKNLVGNWYYFDSDSNYVELYFSNELVSVNSEWWTSAGRLFYYQVYNDKVFSSFDNFKKDKEFIFDIVDYGSDTLLVKTANNEAIKLIKFNIEGEVFTNLCLPMEKEMELIKGRLTREALILGYDTSVYEILELP